MEWKTKEFILFVCPKNRFRFSFSTVFKVRLFMRFYRHLPSIVRASFETVALLFSFHLDCMEQEKPSKWNMFCLSYYFLGWMYAILYFFISLLSYSWWESSDLNSLVSNLSGCVANFMFASLNFLIFEDLSPSLRDASSDALFSLISTDEVRSLNFFSWAVRICFRWTLDIFFVFLLCLSISVDNSLSFLSTSLISLPSAILFPLLEEYIYKSGWGTCFSNRRRASRQAWWRR